MINWISQIGSITAFNLRTIPERKGAAFTAAAGIAGVVAVLVGVLSIAEGFRAAMTVSGAEDVAIVLRTGADSEMTSGLSREETRLIADSPGVARGAGGPMTSAELFVIINLPKRSTGTDANVPFRGVGEAAMDVRGDVKIVEGRTFASGRNEVIVGSGAARAFSGLEVGKSLRIGQNDWAVVGIFSGGGGAAESEIWTDAAVLQPAYNRAETFQSVYARLSSPRHSKPSRMRSPRIRSLRSSHASVGVFGRTIDDADDVHRDHWRRHRGTDGTRGVLRRVEYHVQRGRRAHPRDRHVARARLRLQPGDPFHPVRIDPLALIGGALGAAAAYLAFDGFKTATINWQTFSQVTFAFAVTPALLVSAIVWAACIGLLGGIFPAIRAARLPIAAALRET